MYEKERERKTETGIYSRNNRIIRKSGIIEAELLSLPQQRLDRLLNHRRSAVTVASSSRTRKIDFLHARRVTKEASRGWLSLLVFRVALIILPEERSTENRGLTTIAQRVST